MSLTSTAKMTLLTWMMTKEVVKSHISTLDMPGNVLFDCKSASECTAQRREAALEVVESRADLRKRAEKQCRSWA